MMNLSPTELERLTLFTAAELARRYRSQGVRLSHPEAVALITDEVLTAARRGLAHADLVALGGSLLTTDDVEPGVATMIPFIAMEANMEQGTKLVAIFDPVKPGRQRASFRHKGGHGRWQRQHLHFGTHGIASDVRRTGQGEGRPFGHIRQ